MYLIKVYSIGRLKEVDIDDDIDDIIEEEDEGEEPESKLWRGVESRRYKRNQKRNAIVSRFLDKEETADAVVIQPRYYGELLTWALHRYIEVERWKVVKNVGYRFPKPVYIDVDTGSDERQNVLRDGTLFIEKGDGRFAVTVDINLRRSNSVLVTGPAHRKKQVDEFADGVRTIVREQNFYRGKKLELGGQIRFLDMPGSIWENLILDADTKDDIRANTIGFLVNRERVARYGVPAKRGVLLVGEPGTGKTLACKALLAEASGITCLVANIDAMDAPPYILELYELAEDLSPSIVLIEDIDLIAQERMEFGYSRGSALLTLLSVLDGVKERNGIVTIATTNCQETLDKAISRRPSRFDRVIHFSLPTLKHRKEHVSLLCRKIPLDEAVQGYIAIKTEGFTPAQVQEVVYTLAIGHCQNNDGDKPDVLKFCTEEIDGAISRINGRNRRHLGFTGGNHNGSKPDQIMIIGGQR